MIETPNARRRVATGLAALLGASILLPGCAQLAPRNLSLSQADLQALLERQFPRQTRVLEVVDLSLAQPSVRLLPERNRLATALDLSARERLSGRTLAGSIALDHALRYEPSDGTLRLAQVQVQELKLDLAGTPLSSQAARLGGLLTERLLEDAVIHRLSDEHREALRRAGLERADFVVTARGIELRFTDAR